MGIEPGIRGIVWSYVLCGGRDLDSWKTSLYVWSRSWMEAWSCGLSCKEVAMGSRTWSKRTNAHISFPLVELYTLVADIADIWRGGSYRPWSLIDFLASANSNALLTQSHCMGLCACNQSKPKIASYGCMSRTTMSVQRVCPWQYHCNWETFLFVINHSPFVNFTFLGDMGSTVNFAISTNWDLTKLWELPLSNRISITLSLTLDLILMQLVWSLLEIALRDSWQNSSCKASSVANSLHYYNQTFHSGGVAPIAVQFWSRQ